MTIPALTSTASAATANSSGTPAGGMPIPSQTLGQDDFLKLLVTQMTSQDPMNPQSDADFIAQMAQFSSLQEMKTLGTEVSQMSTQQKFSQAAALLGRTVQVQTSAATTDQGLVTAVQINAGKPQLVVNGANYDLSQVLSVTPAPTSLNSPAPQK